MTGIATGLAPNPASGSVTTDGTEQVLASSTNLGIGAVLSLVVDLAALIDGDVVELSVYSNAGTANDRRAYLATFAHAQRDPLKVSIPIAVEPTGRYRATIKRTAGVDRTHPWKVLAL